MFANIGWGEMLVLVVIGFVILGPERLPGAIRWTSNALRQARDYVSGATSSLREELGPEFDDLREPLAELQKLRGMSPRAALTKHLLDGDDSFLTGKFDKPTSLPPLSRRPSLSQADPMPGLRPTPGGSTPFDRTRRSRLRGRVRAETEFHAGKCE